MCNQYYLVPEFANDGTLLDYLRKGFKNFNGRRKYNLASELINGVKCLHDEDIIHRDLVIYFTCYFLRIKYTTSVLIQISHQHDTNVLVRNGAIKIADLGLAKDAKEIHSSKL